MISFLRHKCVARMLRMCCKCTAGVLLVLQSGVMRQVRSSVLQCVASVLQVCCKRVVSELQCVTVYCLTCRTFLGEHFRVMPYLYSSFSAKKPYN